MCIRDRYNSSDLRQLEVVMKSIQVYDTTLRDGAQREGISFSVSDKIEVVKLLDTLGVDYICLLYTSRCV